MIFTVERAALADAVSKLQRVVGSKSTMPVLEGILISAEPGRLTLAAYNLDMGMKKEIYAKCDEPGDIVITARLLSDILRRMNGIQVEISADDKLMCHIKSGDAVFDITGMAAMDFPEMPSVGDGTKIKVESDIFSEMVRGTLFAVSAIEGTRPILTGLNISVQDGVLQLVGIDGYRLAIRREKTAFKEDIEFIATGRAVGEAVKLIGEETEEIEMIVGKRLISFVIDGYIFISRLLDGEFVNYKKTIPTEYQQSVEMNTRDLIDTVERVSLLISDSFSSPVRCLFDENGVTFGCSTMMGRATEHCDLTFKGDPFEIGLNSRYLLEALKTISDGRIEIRFNGTNSGVVLRSADQENNDFLYMIMPMRLKNESV